MFVSVYRIWGRCETETAWYAGHCFAHYTGLRMNVEVDGMGIAGERKAKYSERTCPSDALSTINNF
jgi:hypothetical protein